MQSHDSHPIAYSAHANRGRGIDLCAVVCYHKHVKTGGAHILSTAKRGSLETFKLFYEEVKPRKTTISRLRRARPGLATK
jgi:hypothetical protein